MTGTIALFPDLEVSTPKPTMARPFAGLIGGPFDLLKADPPWTFKTYSKKGQGKSPQSHYECMSLDDIKALPVASLAKDDSLLWLWATNPMLPQAFEVMEAWGFRYVTAGTWGKQSKTGAKLAFGTGYVLRSASEPFLIGARGKPKTSRSVRSLIMAPVREHSRKPDAAFEAAAQLIAPNADPNPPRLLELFSREDREGWDTWGNETGKFAEEEAARAG